MNAFLLNGGWLVFILLFHAPLYSLLKKRNSNPLLLKKEYGKELKVNFVDGEQKVGAYTNFFIVQIPVPTNNHREYAIKKYAFHSLYDSKKEFLGSLCFALKDKGTLVGLGGPLKNVNGDQVKIFNNCCKILERTYRQIKQENVFHSNDSLFYGKFKRKKVYEEA